MKSLGRDTAGLGHRQEPEWGAQKPTCSLLVLQDPAHRWGSHFRPGVATEAATVHRQGQPPPPCTESVGQW